MNNEINPEQALAETVDGLNGARWKLVLLLNAVNNGYTAVDEISSLASDALAAVDACIMLEATSRLARNELTRRAVRGELGPEAEALVMTPGPGDTIN